MQDITKLTTPIGYLRRFDKETFDALMHHDGGYYTWGGGFSDGWVPRGDLSGCVESMIVRAAPKARKVTLYGLGHKGSWAFSDKKSMSDKFIITFNTSVDDGVPDVDSVKMTIIDGGE